MILLRSARAGRRLGGTLEIRPREVRRQPAAERRQRQGLSRVHVCDGFIGGEDPVRACGSHAAR